MQSKVLAPHLIECFSFKGRMIYKIQKVYCLFLLLFNSDYYHWRSEGDAHLHDLHNHLFSCSAISEHIRTSNKVYLLLPHPKYSGDVVWCALIDCKKVTGWAKLVV